MNSETSLEDVKRKIIERIESLEGLKLQHFYTEMKQGVEDENVKSEDKCLLFFKEINSDVSLIVTFAVAISFMTANLRRNGADPKYVFFDSYLKNNDKDILLDKTEHWNGQRWIVDFDKYLDLISDLATQEFKPVLKGETWIEDYVDLDKYVQGKK